MSTVSSSSREEMLHGRTLLEPVLTKDGIQVSVHTCPKSLFRELKTIFQTVDLSSSPILAVPTCQNAAMDLVQMGAKVEQEKDKLLERFTEWAKEVCEKLHCKGFWADFIDPCSGLPMLTSRSNKVYSEVDGMQVLLRYRTQSAGHCKILLHPLWGSSVYPATLFTTAPQEELLELLYSYLPQERESQ